MATRPSPARQRRGPATSPPKPTRRSPAAPRAPGARTAGNGQRQRRATGPRRRARRQEARGAAPIIHPASENLVRQQLDLLASQQFRWTGEAWPGVPLDWEIQPQTWDDTSGGAATDRAWSTRLRLTLPNLGEVEARLSLHGTGLQALLLTPDRAVARLNAERSALAGNLSANGLVLMRLDVEALPASTQEAAP